MSAIRHARAGASTMINASLGSAVTDADGRFSIEGVPPGSYTLRAWHEKLGEMTKPLTVDASGGSADFVIQPRNRR